MLKINDSAIIGQIFHDQGVDTNKDWTCIGYAANDTFLIVGATFDSTSNRTRIKTFKFQDVLFKGQLSPKV